MPNAKQKILIVEDDDSVRSIVVAMLVDTGYTILKASDGAEALRVCGEHKGRIDLMLTDVVMPKMSGRELADMLVKTHPKMKVLFMSGYTDDAIQHHGVLDPGIAFIEKPFSQVSLTARIREVLSVN